jgi:OPA family glycerol-3-phosphate transporter-like MFS transporter/OPA family sugar phosphate sensor protein UhpC-like MFS transporter
MASPPIASAAATADAAVPAGAHVEPNQIPWLPKYFRQPTPAPAVTDPAQIDREFAHYRPRVLFWTTLGYGIFYFVRKNIPIAMPIMESQLGISKEKLGTILSAHELVYGTSKFGNGMIVDRADGRKIMVVGLVASALVNICFGLSGGFTALLMLWMLNGYFQGMGYPPCARLLTHWFARKELATKMAIWNASHTLGGAGILILGGYLIAHYATWRIVFFVPAGIALVVAAGMAWGLRDTPQSVGLPDVDVWAEGDSPRAGETTPPGEDRESYRTFLWEKVFSNKYIWLASMANFFVYTIRLSVLNWGPMMLKDKGVALISTAGWQTAGFEAGGLVCMLLTGWLTDRLFSGRGAPLSMICMLMCGVAIWLFWKIGGHTVWLNAGLLFAIGFFVYGPQALVAVIVAHLATKRGAATAVGLTSIFGYGSTVLSGAGLGALVQHHGWDAVFPCLIGAAVLGAILFALILPVRVHGEEKAN